MKEAQALMKEVDVMSSSIKGAANFQKRKRIGRPRNRSALEQVFDVAEEQRPRKKKRNADSDDETPKNNAKKVSKRRVKSKNVSQTCLQRFKKLKKNT